MEQVFWHKGNGHSYKQTDFPLLDLTEIPGPDFFRLVAEVNRGLLYLASPYRSNWRVSEAQALERREKVIDFTDRLLGWEDSPGVQKEIDWALTTNKQVLLIEE